MHEIPELDIDLNVEGWERSGGKSYNVWGRVPFPQELLDYINEHKKLNVCFYDGLTGVPIRDYNKKWLWSIWTAYDEDIRKIEGELKSEDLPKISATFKSCFNKYGAVTENIGMKVAVALDMPTSYNYIVSFDPQQHQQIVNNYPNPTRKSKVLPYGIVSIDFLQNKPSPLQESVSEYKNKDGEYEEIQSYSRISGDELVSFEDALRKFKFGTNNLGGEFNLIENWIRVVDELVEKELVGCPRETINETLTKVHSRIARSFLLREFLGDCDFTAYNGGIVYNPATKKMRYAPNHDYGECFNALVRDKLDFDPYCGMTKEQFEAMPESMQAIIQKGHKRNEMSVDEIACQFASGTSEQNLNYVMKNFPKASREFFESLDHVIQKGDLDSIIDEYKDITFKGQPLLNEDERTTFKEFLDARAGWMSDFYVQFIQSQGQEIPCSVISRDGRFF